MKNTLKAILVFSVIIFSSNSYGQATTQDTINLKFVKSDWGFGFTSEFKSITFLNQDVFKTIFLYGGHTSIYRKNLRLSYASFSGLSMQRNEDIIEDAFGYEYIVPKDETLSVISTSISLGYIHDFNKKYSLDINTGYVINKFERDFYEQTYNEAGGWLLNSGLSRNFKLKRNNYCGIRLGIDYSTSNFKREFHQLGMGTMSFSLGITYTGWFRRKVS